MFIYVINLHTICLLMQQQKGPQIPDVVSSILCLWYHDFPVCKSAAIDTCNMVYYFMEIAWCYTSNYGGGSLQFFQRETLSCYIVSLIHLWTAVFFSNMKICSYSGFLVNEVWTNEVDSMYDHNL